MGGSHPSSAITSIAQSSTTTQISQSSAIAKRALGKVNLPELSRLSSCLITKRGINNEDEQKLQEKVIKEINSTRNEIISKWRSRKTSFNFIKAYIVMRPISSTASSTLLPNNNEEDEDEISNVSLAAFGMFHTMILLRSNENDYLLDRCVEGIRLYNLEQLDYSSKNALTKCFEHKQPISLIIFGAYDICVNCYILANWIEEESKIQYNLLLKNCIHFGYDFASKYTREKNITFEHFWKIIREKYWQLSTKLHDHLKKLEKYRQEHGIELSKIVDVFTMASMYNLDIDNWDWDDLQNMGS
jgi:hypothetical protein